MDFPDQPLSPKRQVNRQAFLANKEKLEAMAEDEIRAITDSVIGQDADITTHLAFSCQAIVKLLESTLTAEEKAGLPDGLIVSPYLVPDRQTAIAVLAGYAQAMLAIMQLRAQRDAAVAAFELPHPEVGL